MTAVEQVCSGCEEVKVPDEFGWAKGRLRKKCKACRASDERARNALNRAPRFCSSCGGPLSAQYKLDVCRRTPKCLRISTSRHNFLKTRRSKGYPPCAGCGCDWIRSGGAQRLCPDCRKTQFWCSGFRPDTGHVAPLGACRPRSQGCRACLLLRFALHRSAERRLPFALTGEYVESIWNDTCPYLGIPLRGGVGKLARTSPTLDRIIPALGYVAGNVEVIGHLANTMKSGALPDELVAFARAVLRRHEHAAGAVMS